MPTRPERENDWHHAGMPNLRRPLAVVLAVTAALLLAAPIASAEVLTVTRTDDPVPNGCLPGDCSLREAVVASNASTLVDDRIVIPASETPYQLGAEALTLADEVEVVGAGADRTTIRGVPTIVALANNGVATLVDLRITEGRGAIQNNGEFLTLRRVSVDHNSRPDAGGAIQTNSPLRVESSFIGFNRVDGISGGAIQANGPVTIVNSTFFQNSSNGPSVVNGNDRVTIASSAFVSNRVTSPLGAALTGLPLVVRDSVFSDNRNESGLLSCEEPTSLGGNVEDGASCATGAGDRPNAVVGLGELALHGGTTPVHSLLPTSAAIDAAGECPALDQRGGPRPLGAACDSGPFELAPLGPVPPVPPGPADRTVAVELGRGKLVLDPKNRIHLRLTCPTAEATPPCTGTVALRTKTKAPFGNTRRKQRLGLARFALGAGKGKAIVFKLAPLKAELVRELKAPRRLEVEISAADGAGNRTVLRQVRPVAVRLIPPF
jgi:hypothetical protein